VTFLNVKDFAMAQEISINYLGPSEILFNDLVSVLGGQCDINLELRESNAKDRSAIDPTIIVAAIGVASAAIPVLLKGLFEILAPTAKIVLKGKNGRSIEVPVGTPDERIRELMDLTKGLDNEEIAIGEDK